MWLEHHFQFPDSCKEGRHCQGYWSRQEASFCLRRGAGFQDKLVSCFWSCERLVLSPRCKPRAEGDQRLNHEPGAVEEAEQNIKEKEVKLVDRG